jgi:hypothetical protein
VDQTRYFKEIGISLILTMITVAVLCPFKIMKILIAYDIIYDYLSKQVAVF